MAGPVSNLILAGLCYLIVMLLAVITTLTNFGYETLLRYSNVFDFVVQLNIILAIFNLIPAFPLDGGRILRSALVIMTKDYSKGTRWAVAVGRFFAIGLITLSIIYFNPILLLISVFILFVGKAECKGLDNESKLPDMCSDRERQVQV